MFLYRLYPKIIMSVSKPHRTLTVFSPYPRRTLNRTLTVPVMYLFVYCSGWEPLFTLSIPSVQRSRSLEYHSGIDSPTEKSPSPLCISFFFRTFAAVMPPAGVAELWRKDYGSMRTSMIYGDSPAWQELTDSLNRLQKQITELPYDN